MRVALIFAALLAGCESSDRLEGKAPFEVDALFTKDGCTVYRFEGYTERERHYGYFTNCDGSAEWNVSCGKGQSCRMQTTGKNRPSHPTKDE